MQSFTGFEIKEYTDRLLEFSNLSEEDKQLEEARLKYINKPPILTENQRQSFIAEWNKNGHKPKDWYNKLFENQTGKSTLKINLPDKLSFLSDRKIDIEPNNLLFYNATGNSFISTMDEVRQKYDLNMIELRRSINTNEPLNILGRSYIVISLESKTEMLQAAALLNIKSVGGTMTESSGVGDYSEDYTSTESFSTKPPSEPPSDSALQIKNIPPSNLLKGNISSTITNAEKEKDLNEWLNQHTDSILYDEEVMTVISEATKNSDLTLNTEDGLYEQLSEYMSDKDRVKIEKRIVENAAKFKIEMPTQSVSDTSSIVAAEELQARLQLMKPLPESDLRDLNSVLVNNVFPPEIRELIASSDDSDIDVVIQFAKNLKEELKHEKIKEEVYEDIKKEIVNDFNTKLEKLRTDAQSMFVQIGKGFTSTFDSIKTLHESVLNNANEIEKEKMDRLIDNYERVKREFQLYVANEILNGNEENLSTISNSVREVIQSNYDLPQLQEFSEIISPEPQIIRQQLQQSVDVKNYLQNAARSKIDYMRYKNGISKITDITNTVRRNKEFTYAHKQYFDYIREITKDAIELGLRTKLPSMVATKLKGLKAESENYAVGKTLKEITIPKQKYIVQKMRRIGREVSEMKRAQALMKSRNPFFFK